MPPAVWPELAPPFTLRTTETDAGVPRSSSATSGIRRPLPSSPREIPTSAMSWLENGMSDMGCRGATGSSPREEQPLLPKRKNAPTGSSANKNPKDDAGVIGLRSHGWSGAVNGSLRENGRTKDDVSRNTPKRSQHSARLVLIIVAHVN